MSALYEPFEAYIEFLRSLDDETHKNFLNQIDMYEADVRYMSPNDLQKWLFFFQATKRTTKDLKYWFDDRCLYSIVEEIKLRLPEFLN